MDEPEIDAPLLEELETPLPPEENEVGVDEALELEEPETPEVLDAGQVQDATGEEAVANPEEPLPEASAVGDLQGVLQQVAQAIAPPAAATEPPPAEAPAETPIAPASEDAPEADPEVQVTPEEVAQFKAENPLFAGLDDTQAAAALREIKAATASETEATQLREAERAEPRIEDVEPLPEVEARALAYAKKHDNAFAPVAAGIIKSGLETYDFVNETVLGNTPAPGDWRKGFEGYYDKLSGISSVSATIAQWTTAFVGIGKFARMVGVARAAGSGTLGFNVARGAGADLLAFDGHANRISNYVQHSDSFGDSLANPITGFLASSPDDSEAFGRLKNALEGAGLGLTVDAALHMFRALRSSKAGDAEGAATAADDAIKQFDELNADKPQAAADATQPQVAKAGGEESGAKATAEAPDVPVASQTAPLLDAFRLKAVAREIAGDIANDPLKRPLFTEFPQQAPTPSTFDSLVDADDLRSIVQATEDEILKGIDGSLTSKSGPVSIEESGRLAKEFAEMTGTSVGVFKARMQRDADSIEQFYARLLAYDQTTRTLAAGLRDIAIAVRRKEPGEFGSLEALHSAFETRLATYAQIQDWLKGIRSGTGRALNILKYSRQLGPAVQSADGSAISALRNGKSIEDLAEEVLLAGTDRAALAKIADPTIYERSRDALVALFIKNILSGITTHTTNIVGNSLASLTHPASKIIGGALRADGDLMSQGVRQYGYMLSESLSAVKMAGEAYKRGHAILDGQARKLSGTPVEALEAGRLGIDPQSITGRIFNAGATVLDGVSTRALEASDEFFKQTLYSSEIMARSFTDGVNLGLKGAELKQYVAAQRDAAFTQVDDIGPRVANPEASANAKAALDVARIGTFTQDVKPKGVASYVLAGTNRWPELKFAVPFVRVVNNILSYSAAMTPGLQGLSRIYKDAVAKGGTDAAVAQGRLALGSALWTAAVGLAAGGYITGSGPKEYKKKQQLEQTGWRAHSLRVNGTYIPLDRLDPIGFPFNLAGDFYQRWQEGDRDDDSATQVAAAMALAFYHNIADRSFLKGFTDLFNAIGDKDGSKLELFTQNVAGSLLVPNFVRQNITNQVDPYLHEARGLMENVMRRVPGLSDNLAVRRMPWGEKMLLNPALYNADKADPVMQEYARLLQTGEQGLPDPLPRMKDRPGEEKLDLAREVLPDGQTLYDVYGDLIEQPTPETRPLKEVLTELMQSADYRDKLIDGPGTLNGTRLKAVRTIIGRYRQAAWRVVLQQYPEVREKVYAKKRDTAARARAAQESVEMENYINE